MDTTSSSFENQETLTQFWYYPVIIVIASLAAYANHFDGVFLLDDLSNIVENSSLSFVGGIEKNWQELFADGRPIVFLSLLADFRLWGLNAFGYHFFNLAVHILAGLCAYGFVSTILRCSPSVPQSLRKNSSTIAFLSALLWVLHPINTQSVTYIIQRAESLMGLFFLLSVYAASKCFSLQDTPNAAGSMLRWQWVAIIGAILSIASKQVAVALPIVIVASHWLFWFDKSKSSFLKALVQNRFLYLGLLVTYVAAILLLTLPDLDPNSGFHYKGVSPFDYLKSQPMILLHYIGLVVWPKTLVLDYGWPVATQYSAIAISGAIVTAMFATTLWGLKGRKTWSFAGVWFFVILAPTSSFLPIKDLAFEHRMYLPSLAILAAIVCAAWMLASRFDRIRWFYYAVAIVALVFGLRTHMRNYDYRSAITMWSSVLDARPQNPRAYNELGNALRQVGRKAESLQLYQKAMVIEPQNPGPLLNISNLLLEAGKTDPAQEALFKAVEIRPEFASAHFNIGNIYFSKNDLKNAELSYRKTLRLSPNYAEAYVGLGNTLAAGNKFELAMKEYNKSLSLKPWLSQAYNGIAEIFYRSGKTEEAIKFYIEAINRNKNDAAIRVNFANALVTFGKAEEAKNQYTIALKIAPGYKPALEGLKRIEEITP